jgi:nicotinamidase-related amidase
MGGAVANGMADTTGLMFGALSPGCVHLCIDMQCLFAAGGPWPVPWIEKVMPQVCEIARYHAAQTVFTRFVPPPSPEAMPGAWRRYYAHWREVTLERMDPALLELLAPLRSFIPPAVMIDRGVYSAFAGSKLGALLAERRADTLLITGGETDMCVLATTLAAVDRGFRVVMIADALCSSSDPGHDAMIAHFNTRFSRQIETIKTEVLLSAWAPQR